MMKHRSGAIIKYVATIVLVFVLMLAGRADATLVDRGNGLIYDDVLDITWLQNANLANQAFTWQDAVDWAENLVYQGFDDWRLPSMDVNNNGTVDVCSTNVDCPDNEYGHMYYQNLNGVSGQTRTGNQVGDGGVTLNNIQCC